VFDKKWDSNAEGNSIWNFNFNSNGSPSKNKKDENSGSKGLWDSK